MKEIAKGKAYSAKDRIYDLMRIRLADHPPEINDVQFAFMISKTILEIFLSEQQNLRENISNFLRFSTQACPMEEDAIAASEKNYTKVDITGCPTEEEIETYAMPFVEKSTEEKRNPYFELRQILTMNRRMHTSTIMQVNPELKTENAVMEERIQKSTEAIMVFLSEEPNTNMKIGFIQMLLYGSNILPFASIFEDEGFVWAKEELMPFIRESRADEEVFTKVEGHFKDFTLSQNRIADLLPDSISFALKTVAEKYPEWKIFIDTPAFKEFYNSVATVFHFHAMRLGAEFEFMKIRLLEEVKNFSYQQSKEAKIEENIEAIEMFNLEYNLKMLEMSDNSRATDAMESFLKEKGNEKLIKRFEDWKEQQHRQEEAKKKEKKTLQGGI